MVVERMVAGGGGVRYFFEWRKEETRVDWWVLRAE